jgi:hypothetical protein
VTTDHPDRRRRRRAILQVPALLLLLLIGLAAPALAEPPPRTPDNPKPLEGDLVVPLPGGREIVFRPVVVPGDSFWGDPARLVQIGDATGGPFEGLQRLQVSGSFPAGDHWLMYLAKYELTKGQVVVILGVDEMARLSADPEDARLRQMDERALEKALRLPATHLGPRAIDAFLFRLNGWLFAPENPERRAMLPTVDGVPAFMRLPTEAEWEYAARGGLPALQAGTFTDRLPFPIRRLDEFAWHLGNAKNRPRPIGLREPNPLGLHDMFGNVSEMVAGIFRPELWQGKPGGVPVRGASVSTPAQDVRAANRGELDAWGWNVDARVMEEKRSFNIGARLALGSNVNVTTAVNREITAAYETYAEALRVATPVGRTLDNAVAQAALQLSNSDPLIAGLIARNPDLAQPLAQVQAYLDKAKAQLDQAQKDSAISLARDATRAGITLSGHLTRLAKLRGSLEAARKLAELSTRYQDQIAAVEATIAELDADVTAQVDVYGAKVAALGDYGQDYIDGALGALDDSARLPREQAVVGLLGGHVAEYARARRIDRDGWRQDFVTTFEALGRE